MVTQGHNFGLKSGGTNSEGERDAIGSRDERGRELGGSIPSLSNTGVYESVVSSSSGGPRRTLPAGVRGEAPAENGFYCNLVSADRFCWQQILHLFVLKSDGYCTLSPKSGVTGTPGKLRLCADSNIMFSFIAQYARFHKTKECNT